MADLHGDHAVKQPSARPEHEAGFLHQLHNLSPAHLLHEIKALGHHPQHSAHLPEMCINAEQPNRNAINDTRQSLVADEDQSQDKLLARRAICGNPSDTRGSLVADEDQNQDKLISRIALRPTPSDTRGSFVADEDQNQDKLISHKAICGTPSDTRGSLVADEDQNQDKLMLRIRALASCEK